MAIGTLFVITILIAFPAAVVLAVVAGSDSLGEALGCLGVIALMVVLFFAVVGGGFSLLLHSCSV